MKPSHFAIWESSGSDDDSSVKRPRGEREVKLRGERLGSGEGGNCVVETEESFGVEGISRESESPLFHSSSKEKESESGR